MKQQRITRREFVGIAGASAFACTYVPSRVFGASERLNVANPQDWTVRAGVVGLIGEAMAHASEFADRDTLSPLYLRRPAAEEKRLADEADALQ